MDKVRIFLSSTSGDLQDERRAVEIVVKRMDIPLVGMEYFGSDHDSPVQVSLDKLRQCSIYVGIIGFRYGSLVPNSGMSFTEAEYREAVHLGIPCLLYLKSTEAKVRFASLDTDLESRVKLGNFRAEVESKHVISYFVDDQQLAAMIAADLYRLLSRRPETTALVAETDLLQVPRVIIKRAEIALLDVMRFIQAAYYDEQTGRIPTGSGNQRALEFIDSYHLQFDGQITVLNSQHIVIYHKEKRVVGRRFAFADLDTSPLVQELAKGKENGTLKWVDQLSSDYLSVSDIFYAGAPRPQWIRFNIAPFASFRSWDWYVLIEAHNEIHGLDPETIKTMMTEFRNKGWLVLASK